MELLLKHGAKVNALDSLGQTCLHRAGREGNVQACRILLTFGVDPSIVSLQGYTAAQLATDSVAKLLAEEPANGGIDIEYQLLEASKVGFSNIGLFKIYMKFVRSSFLRPGILNESSLV